MIKMKRRGRKKRRSMLEVGLRHEQRALQKRNPECSYEEYLASDLWKVIRRRVLIRDHHKCQGCGAKAQAVHHKSYDAAVMDGEQDSALVAICFDCHEAIEFDTTPSGAKVKNSLKDANRKLKELRARHWPTPAPKVKKEPPKPKVIIQKVIAVQVKCEKCVEEGSANLAPVGKTLCRRHQGITKPKVKRPVGKGISDKFEVHGCRSPRCRNPAYGIAAYCRTCQGVFGNVRRTAAVATLYSGMVN